MNLCIECMLNWKLDSIDLLYKWYNSYEEIDFWALFAGRAVLFWEIKVL